MYRRPPPLRKNRGGWCLYTGYGVVGAKTSSIFSLLN